MERNDDICADDRWMYQLDEECECPANQFYKKYGEMLRQYLMSLEEKKSGTVEEEEPYIQEPNYVVEIIKEEIVTDIHETRKETRETLPDIQETTTEIFETTTDIHETLTDMYETTTDLRDTLTDINDTVTDLETFFEKKTSIDITQSLIELCKDINKPEGDYDFISIYLRDLLENVMEYSDNRIDTCSCLFRDDDAYICGDKKDETETCCIAILTGRRTTCSSSIDLLPQPCQNEVCTCRICVCEKVEEEEEEIPGMFTTGQFDEFEGEEKIDEEEEEEEEEKSVQKEWKSYSLAQAEEYLRNHRIKDLFNYMNACLLANNPENPIQYVINLLDRCILYRHGQIGPPLLFSKRHLESLFNSMDRMGYGYIDIMQYKAGMLTLGLEFYNPYPMLDNNGNVTKNVFIEEALKCMQLSFDEMIKMRNESTPDSDSDFGTITSDSSKSSKCRCNVSMVS